MDSLGEHDIPQSEQQPEQQPDLVLINCEQNDGSEEPFFGRYWGSPTELDQILDETKKQSSASSVVETVLVGILPAEFLDDGHFQEWMHSRLQAAEDYYTKTVWPTYPRGSANTDLLGDLYEATEEYDDCTLLHTIRCLDDQSALVKYDPKDAERIALILIWNELRPAEEVGELPPEA